MTVVFPRGKVSGASFDITEMFPSTLSVAEAPARKAAICSLVAGTPFSSTAGTVISEGTETTGLV